MITGVELQGALLRRAISPKDFARTAQRSQKTIERWLRGGVPEKEEHFVKGWLKTTEIETGGIQLDAFPETIRWLL